MSDIRQIGSEGENRASSYLENNGYEILHRNFRLRDGEIDIVASRDDFIVFVEVKTLPGGNAEILAHELNKIKQKKIIKTAKRYLQKYRQYSNKLVRFDVLALDVPGLDPVYHIENAFLE
ncbi:MAG: YraN family protein [Treponema sp.]|nr:YraN family protein [Treponema sp.]